MTPAESPAPRRGLAIEVVDATKQIDGLLVLDGVTFTALPGRITAFLGPNGAGKSTTLRSVLGIDRLDGGRATIGGIPFADHREPVRVAGALLSPDTVHPARSARGHLRVVATAGGLPRAAVEEAVELVGLQDLGDLPAGQMSLGMRQRLGLATALIGDPAVIVLDEPHNGLDAAAIRWLRSVLRLLADAGRTVLLSSHLMGELQEIADDVVVIDRGRVVAADTVPEFVAGGSLEDRYLAAVGGAS